MTSNENDCKTLEDFNLKNHLDSTYIKNSTENIRLFYLTMLRDKPDEDLELKESFNHVFINPYGYKSLYVYVLFQRKSY